MSRILCVDPGKMTGFGYLLTGPDKACNFIGGEMAHDDFIDWTRTVFIAHGVTTQYGPEAIVDTETRIDGVLVEGFTISQRTIQQAPTDAQMWSVKQIGWLETLCRWYDVPIVRQMPSAKDFGTDAKLKAVGWWKPTPGVTGEKGHRRDAARHALKYAADRGLIDLRRLIA